VVTGPVRVTFRADLRRGGGPFGRPNRT